MSRARLSGPINSMVDERQSDLEVLVPSYGGYGLHGPRLSETGFSSFGSECWSCVSPADDFSILNVIITMTIGAPSDGQCQTEWHSSVAIDLSSRSVVPSGLAATAEPVGGGLCNDQRASGRLWG